MYAGSNDASNGINDPGQSSSNAHIHHPYPQAPDSLFSHLSLRSSTSSPSGSQAHTRSSSVASTSHLHSYSSTATSESESEVSVYPIRPLRSSSSYHPELDPSQPSSSGSTSSQQPPATSTRALTSAEKGKAKAAASSTAAVGSSSSAKRAKKRLAEPEEYDDENFEEGGEEDSQGVKRKLSLRTKNRLKQRAHRERRAQYLAELEAKAAMLTSTQDELVELKATLFSTQEDLDRSRRELEKSASMGAEREAMVRWLEGELIKARMGQPAGEMVASGRQERRSEGGSGSGSGKGSSRSSSSSHSRVSSNLSNGSGRPSSSSYHNIPSTAPPAGFASFQQQQAQHQHHHPYSSNDSSSRHASSQPSLRRPSWNSTHHYPLSPPIPVLPKHLPPPPTSIQHQLRLQQEAVNRTGGGRQEPTFEGWAQQQQQQPPMMAMAGIRMMHPTVRHQHQQQQGFPAVQGSQGHHRASTHHSELEPFYSPNLNHGRARANSDSEFLTTPINAVASSSSFDPDAWNTLQSYDLATAGWTNDPSSNPQHSSLSFDPARSDRHPGDPNSTFDFSPNTALPRSPAAHSISASVVSFLTDSSEMLAASPGSSSQQPSSYLNPVRYQARSQPFQSRQHPHHNFHVSGTSPSPTLSSSSAKPQPGQPPTRSSSLLSSLPPLQTTFAPRVSPLAPHLRPVRQSSVPSNLEQYDLNTNNNNADRFTSSPSSINDRHDDHNVPFLSDPSINPSPISGFPSCSGSGGSEEDVRGSRPVGLPRSTSSGSASFLGFSSSTSNEATPTGPGPYASTDWLSFAEGGGGGRGVESSMLGEGQAEMMISPVDE